MRLALAFALLAPLAATAGDIYRCTDAAGKVEYRNSPCAAAVASKRVDIQPPAPSLDAELSRARVAQDSADFNERFYRQQEARRQGAATPYYYPEPIVVTQPAEPVYYGYAVPVPERRRARHTKPPPPAGTIPQRPSPLMKR